MVSFSLVNETRNPTPRVSFRKVANAVMPAAYSLTVIISTPGRIQKLNRTYRHKDTSTDILSFPLSKNEGEIYLSLKDVSRKAPEFGMSERKYLEYVYIHGLVHLQGLDHGKRMEQLEKKFCSQFGFQTPPYAS